MTTDQHESDPTAQTATQAATSAQAADAPTDAGVGETAPPRTGPTDAGPARTEPASRGPTNPGPESTGPTNTGPTSHGPTTDDRADGAAPELDAQTRAEIDAAMDALVDAGAADDPRAAQVRKPAIRGPRKVEGGREHRSGTVVSVGPTDVFIEFGPKEIGVVERTQFKNAEELPKPGDQLEVVIQKYEAGESLYICVLPGAVQKADWEMLEPGQTVEARCTGTNKGGLEMEISGHRAFMPASQVDIDRVPDLAVFVGEKLTCRVQRIDRRGAGNIVLSRRDVIAEDRAKAAEKLRASLQEGDTLDGVVRKVMDFGAFVDLGGIDGLVHISDLSHDRVNHGAKNVAKHVSPGQKVKVQILKVDWDQNRISLGMKQLQADPFEAAAGDVVEGATLSGKVTNIADFGAFVEVAPGVEGLVHISELDWKRVGKVSDVVQTGEVVQVRVLKIDPETRKLSLSIKQTKDAPKQDARARGRGDRDGRSPEEILKETPALRRLREQAKKAGKGGKGDKPGGLGSAGGMGIGLGDLKL